jgi:hypothetical protein
MLEMPTQCRCNAVPLAVLGEQLTYLRTNAQHTDTENLICSPFIGDAKLPTASASMISSSTTARSVVGEPNPNWHIGKKLCSIPHETCGI